jgi:nitroreductase
MDFIEAIKARKSIRNFLDKKVESETLSNILEIARLAPSFFNRQEYRFVIVQDKIIKNNLVKNANCPTFVDESPVLIVCCGKPIQPMENSDHSSYIIDATIALNYVTLAAIEHGLGSCWISIYDEDKLKQILGIPEQINVIALVSLGYPKKIPKSETKKRRLPLAQLIKFEKW